MIALRGTESDRRSPGSIAAAVPGTPRHPSERKRRDGPQVDVHVLPELLEVWDRDGVAVPSAGATVRLRRARILAEVDSVGVDVKKARRDWHSAFG